MSVNKGRAALHPMPHPPVTMSRLPAHDPWERASGHRTHVNSECTDGMIKSENVKCRQTHCVSTPDMQTNHLKILYNNGIKLNFIIVWAIDIENILLS